MGYAHEDESGKRIQTIENFSDLRELVSEQIEHWDLNCYTIEDYNEITQAVADNLRWAIGKNWHDVTDEDMRDASIEFELKEEKENEIKMPF